MSASKSSSEERRLTPFGRLADSLLAQKPGRFVAELVLIVAGILIALGIDGKVSDARDRQTETTYLQLLARDIDAIRQRVEEKIEYEKNIVATGSRAYAVLSAPDPAANSAELRPLLGGLMGRRTLVLNSATFDQMVSSGHLQLVRNSELRDQLVRYFDAMDRMESITEKNNRDLIDTVYTPFLMRVGVSVDGGLVRSRTDEIMKASLGSDLSIPMDTVLLQPPDAETWNDIRRNVLHRTRMAAVGQGQAEEILQQTDEIAKALSVETGGS